MKTLKLIIPVIIGMIVIVSSVFAQNYKAPKIDASGKITDIDGKHIGTVNTKGEIIDAMGMKIAAIDANGNLVDASTGKKLGKAEKNGNFQSFMNETLDKSYEISAPANGVCLVKNKDGKVVGEVHENYKMYGACAIHCLNTGMKHGEILDKSKCMSTYVCPMHPNQISDKAGKCSKCGMDLKKK
jgi:hypothetical protein